MSKKFLVKLSSKYKIQFKEIESLSDTKYLSLEGNKKDIATIGDELFDFPSTNGLYTMYSPKGDFKERIYICTDEFCEMFENDRHINTMSSNQNLFFRGKYLNVKTFLKKQLIWAMIPNKYNDVVNTAETYDEIVRSELMSMSVVELRNVLSNKGLPSSGKVKNELVSRVLRILKFN